MEIALDPPQSRNSIRRITDEGVVIGERTLVRSFVVTAERVDEEWPERDIGDLDQHTVARLLALDPTPEVVLLGSGPRQHFAAPQVQAGLLEQGIGLECMDNAACARTFNLLVNEGRHVAAVFLLP